MKKSHESSPPNDPIQVTLNRSVASSSEQVSCSNMHTSKNGNSLLGESSDRSEEESARLKEFVQSFVEEMEAKLMSYYLIREGKIKKAGRFSGVFAEKVGQVFGGALGGTLGLLIGFPFSGANAGSQVGGKITKRISSCIKENDNMKKANNLSIWIDNLMEDKASLRESFVEAGFDVFQSFEMQFMRVTCDGRPLKAMQMFAKDAMNRVFDCMNKSNQSSTQVSLAESVLLGKSKVKSLLEFAPGTRTNPGFEVYFEGSKWNTANLFEKVGIFLINPSPVYFRLKNRKNITEYGYRRLLIDEDWKQIVQKYEPDEATKNNLRFRNYDYFFDPTNFKSEVEILLNEINKNDKDLEEERVKISLQEAKEDILEAVNSLKLQSIGDSNDREILLTIESSLNQLNLETYFERFKQCVLDTHIEMASQIAKGFQEACYERFSIHEQSEASINELKEYLPDAVAKRTAEEVVKLFTKQMEVNRIWFDMRKNVTSFTALSPIRLDKLREIADNIKSKIVVIAGLDGVGKTELAIRYAHRDHEEDSVILLNSRTYESMKDSFHGLCKNRLNIKIKNVEEEEKPLKDLAKDIYKHFEHKSSVFIFNNAEDSALVHELLPSDDLSPKSRMPFILITSPTSNWKYQTRKVAIVQLGDFNDEEAREFVKKSLESMDNLNSEQISDLVKKLHRFPLALHQAVVYIEEKNKELKKRNSQFQIHDYLEIFEQKPRKLLSVKLPPDVHTKTLFQILEDKIKKIKSDSELGTLAINMLNIISYFAPDHIPEELFLDELASGEENKLFGITQILENQSILRVENKKLFIHAMIQQVVRLELEENQTMKMHPCEEEVLEKALTLLEKCLADPETLSRYVSHISTIWVYASKYEKLIKTFIVDVMETESSGFTSYFHVIAESHNYKVSLDILRIIEKNHPKQLIDVIRARNGNKQYNVKESPLHCAARSGNEHLVTLLLKKGADYNIKNRCKWTPLHFASQHGHLKIVTELLKKDSNTNALKTSFGFTPLHLSAQNGHLDIVEILLEKGSADVNDETNYLFTPLHLAAERGHLDIVEFLLDKKADVNARTGRHFTPLHFAVTNSHLRVADILIKYGCDVNASDDGGFTALHIAAQTGDEELVHILLNCRDIDVNAQTTKHNTPLHLATQNNHLRVVQLLITKNAQPLPENNGRNKASVA